jgi:hypothetical protein
MGGWVDGWMGGWVDGWMGTAMRERLLHRNESRGDLLSAIQNEIDTKIKSLCDSSPPPDLAFISGLLFLFKEFTIRKKGGQKGKEA